MLVVRNPKAGSFKSQNTFLEAAGVIFKSDYNVYVYSTQCPGDATRIVAEEGEKYDRVVAFGGDGTLHEVINGLMRLKSPPVLGYIPAGMTNDFAVGVGLPRNIIRAAETVVDGHADPIDIGCFNNEKYFSYVASFGSFSKASYSAPQDAKNLLGYAAYILEGLKSLSEIKPYHAVVRVENAEYEDDFIFGAVSNALSVGGLLKLNSNEVDLQDGLFEVIMIKEPKSLSQLQKLLYDLAVHRYDSEQILYLQSSDITVECDALPAWTVDGELGGAQKITHLVNCSRALNILRPTEADHA
ncbi:MAG: diacylglycerol kinase family lipid kinase [Oscillospiraceae bacterium]|nr:diacylglycerol kinase family lipid kinase [Oscillospiraceae bacterium]